MLGAEGLLWQDGGVPLYTNSYIEYTGSCVQHEDGGCMILWSENIAGHSDLYLMRYDDSGNQLWFEPRSLTDDMSKPYLPRMIRTSDGNLLAAWIIYDSDSNMYCTSMKFDWDAALLWTQPVIASVNFETKYPTLDCIADDRGGAYILWTAMTNNFHLLQRVNHIDSCGNLDWPDGALDLFPGNYVISEEFNICSDGEGGFIISSVLDNEEVSDFLIAIQRVTPEGDTPWGDEGYINLEDSTIYWSTFTDIQQAGENQFAVFTTLSDSTGTGFRMRRLNRDGEILSDVPYYQDYAFSTSNLFQSKLDSEGNLLLGWIEDVGYYTSVQVGKITPDNVLHWVPEDIDNAGEYGNIRSMTLSLDDDDMLYQSWSLDDYGTNNYTLRIQQYDHDGSPCWGNNGTIVVDQVPSIGEWSLISGNDSNTLFWTDTRNDFANLFEQTYDNMGNPQWQNEGAVVRQGWESTVYFLMNSDSGNAAENIIYFAWYNNIDGCCYLQTVDMNGEGPRVVIHDNPRYTYEIEAVEVVDQDALIVWTQYSDLITSTRVNRFDSQGNRLWEEDLVVIEDGATSTFNYSNIVVGRYLDDLMIGWEESRSHNEKVMLQRVSDGLLAWSEPVRIGEVEVQNLFLEAIVDNYVVWRDNMYRVMRVADDGSPCEGWEQAGTRIVSIDANHNDWQYFNTEEGLVIVWKMTNNVSNTIRIQLVYRDGTTEWSNSHALIVEESLARLRATVEGKELYVSWYNGDINFEAFSLGGDHLWDSRIVIDEGWVITDLQTTTNGLLIAYYYSNGGYYSNDIGLQHLSIDGEFWSEPLIVSGDPYRQINLDIIKATDDKYFLTWMDNRDGNGLFIPYVQLYDHQPTAVDESSETPPWNPDLRITPNPFNPETAIKFSLPCESDVDLCIYNVKGQLVRKLFDGLLPAGGHEISWDGTDSNRKIVATGVYLINLNIDGKSYRRKSLLLK